jgi:hypothetical protein
MGRPPGELDKYETIGMYGIGMKRAIFKMGKKARVTSKHENSAFEVRIEPKWLTDENDWELPIKSLKAKDVDEGTLIEIEDLRDDVAASFELKRDPFVNELKRYISEHYAIILSKGFGVTVNGMQMQPRPFQLLAATSDSRSKALKPYVFEAEIDGVSVELFAGLWRQIPTEEELESEQATRSSREDAGWTIVCNDRVVVFRDKGRLTGWGEANVPSYHNQFIAITGIVFLKSSDKWRLPLTTTKRGIDASSDLYLQVKDYMREATKHFTSFTYRWKKFPKELSTVYRNAAAKEISELRTELSKESFESVRKTPGAKRFVPNLPTPPQVEKKDVRISYTRLKSDVRLVARYLFEDPEVDPSEVGLETFKHVLKAAKSV